MSFMTIYDYMDACSTPEIQEFYVYNLTTGAVVWSGTIEDDCPYECADVLTWDIDTDGKLYFNIEL